MQFINRNDLYISINHKIKIKLSELLFLFPFIVYLINESMLTTMFSVHMSGIVTKIINIFLIISIFIKITLFDKYSIEDIIMIKILGFTALLCFILTKQIKIINLFILIIGAKDVSFRKIINAYFYITLWVMIIAMISVKLGIIEHIITERNGLLRYSFGSIYATNFSAHVFYLIISYIYINYNRIKLLHSLIFGILGCFVYRFCGARLDFISIMMITLFSIYMNLNKERIIHNRKLSKINKVLLIYSVTLCALISIITTLLYNPSSIKMINLDKILSNRLSQGMKGITEYGMKLFGQNITMIGNGGTSESIIKDYFFIDCSYLNIALRYGVILLIIICFYYAIYNMKKINEGNILIPILILFIAINSCIAHHFINIAYNPFILVLFSLDKQIYKNNKITH